MANKLGSKESLNDILTSRMAVIRQWDKKQALKYLIPQRVENGKLYSFNDKVIMSYSEGEDCVFFEDASIIDDATRITDKLLNEIYRPINAYFGSASEQAEVEVVPEGNEDVTETEGNDEKDFDLVGEIEGMITNGNFKKAKKFLKKNEDHEDFKKAKKILKKVSK